jgi:hypothetical protein
MINHPSSWTTDGWLYTSDLWSSLNKACLNENEPSTKGRTYVRKKEGDQKSFAFGSHLLPSNISSFSKQAFVTATTMAPKDSTKTKKEAIQGDPIRFIGGKYEGLEGWLDKSKAANDSKWVYVIVREEEVVDKTCTSNHRPTRVQLSSIALPLGNPRNKAEEFLQYHRDIDKLSNDLAKKIAQCDHKQTDDEFIEEYVQLLREKIAWSKNVQKLMGNKSLYRMGP